MKKELLQKAIECTKEAVTRYWKHDCGYILDHLSSDVMMIGSSPNQFVFGRNEVMDDLKKNIKEKPVCHLMRQEFWSIANDRNTCTIVGRYLLRADMREKEIFEEEQRISFIWGLDSHRNLEIIHMHISNPMTIVEDETVFPHTIGKRTYEYLQNMIAANEQGRGTISFKDDRGHIRFVALPEIEYAMAQGHDTVVYTLSESIQAKISWKEFLKLLDDHFLQVHRSYAVQKNYVKLISKNFLEMKSGDCVPVPVKSVSKVISALNEK